MHTATWLKSIVASEVIPRFNQLSQLVFLDDFFANHFTKPVPLFVAQVGFHRVEKLVYVSCV